MSLTYILFFYGSLFTKFKQTPNIMFETILSISFAKDVNIRFKRERGGPNVWLGAF